MIQHGYSSNHSLYTILVTLGSSSGHVINFTTGQRLILNFGVSPSAAPTNSQLCELIKFIGNKTALYVNAIGYAIDGGKKIGNKRGPAYLPITDETISQFVNQEFVNLLPKTGNHIIFNRNYKLLGGKEFSGQWAIQAQWLINNLALERLCWYVALTCIFLCLLLWYSTDMKSALGLSVITSLSFLATSFFPRAPSILIDCGGRSMTVYSTLIPYWRIGRIFGFIQNRIYLKNTILTNRLQEFEVNPNKLYASDPTGKRFAFEANRAIDSLGVNPNEVIIFQTGNMRRDNIKTFLSSGYQLNLLSQEDEIKLEQRDLMVNIFGRAISCFYLELDQDEVSVIGY